MHKKFSKKIRFSCSVLLILCLTLCCACEANKSLKKDYVLDEIPDHDYDSVSYTVDNTTPYEELITKKVDIHTFAQKYSSFIFPWTVDMSQICNDVGIECIRETDEGALYSVHKVKQGGLLYVFYNNESWREKNDDRWVRRWFYVREDLKYADFKQVLEEKGTMSDIIAVDEAGQIFDNIFSGEWVDEKKSVDYFDKGYYSTWHYLSDGILEIGYRKQGDERGIYYHKLEADFNLSDGRDGVDEPYNAKILEIDRIK